MQLTFGMFLDGADWSQNAASLGEIKMGPLQFLGWLESRLGLDGVSVSAPERINEYMQKIRQSDPAWSRASFELDAWSTAKQMLAWRDELFENGWDGKSGPSERLKTLAALEAAPGPLSPGIPDRMKAVLNELRKYHFSDTLILQDPFELLPYFWKQIIDQLQQCGMTVCEQEQSKTCNPEKIQVSGSTEFALAEECVRFLSAGENHKTAIICEGDSAILDGAFQRNGIGRLNAVERSRWRESLQILPLWLETLWKPFNPQRFLELLLLPCSPIPKKLARELVKALQEEPGYDGDAWNEAWERVRTSFTEDGKINLEDPDFQKIIKVWSMLETGCFYAEERVSSEEVSARCDFLIKRLSVQIEKHPELALVTSHAKTLKKIVNGRSMIKRMELARMLDSIISTGTPGNQAGREKTDFAVFSNPGMIDRDFDTILWWDFIDFGAAHSTNWTDDEINAMTGYNRKSMRKLENLSWHNALNHAGKNIVFFIPQLVNGDAVFPHPLLDELKIKKENTFTPEKLTDSEGTWNLAGRSVALERQEVFAPKAKAGIETNSIRPVRRLSYSQLNTLITCPFQWFLQDYIGLKMPPAMTVPTGSLMLGTLAHKVVEEIYKGRETLTVERAVQAAKKKFEQLLPSMAAELLLDGRNVERNRICKTLVESVETLVKEINDRKLLVKGNEKELHGSFDGMDFLGFSDIYLEDACGNKFVIDMKWSSSSYYEKHLKEDKALQLAVYSWLLDDKDLNVQCAYFLFPRKELVYDPEKTWKDLWQNARSAWDQRFAEIHAGKLERGIAEEKDLENSNSALPMTAGCAFCNFAALCKMMEE